MTLTVLTEVILPVRKSTARLCIQFDRLYLSKDYVSAPPRIALLFSIWQGICLLCYPSKRYEQTPARLRFLWRTTRDFSGPVCGGPTNFSSLILNDDAVGYLASSWTLLMRACGIHAFRSCHEMKRRICIPHMWMTGRGTFRVQSMNAKANLTQAIDNLPFTYRMRAAAVFRNIRGMPRIHDVCGESRNRSITYKLTWPYLHYPSTLTEYMDTRSCHAGSPETSRSHLQNS